MSKSKEVGQARRPNSFFDRDKGELKGCVYSDGPINVYNKLNFGPKSVSTPRKHQHALKKKEKLNFLPILPSASLRRQQQLANSLKSRQARSTSTPFVTCPTHPDGAQNSS
ncbi:hypothetical protein A2U01_0049644 [Trifolium medium]|uniref:Uncharacterized protein n=1 Tax=Trifolium medium TaxID=97028 RepID=A0A392QVQ6_9FABA|nr:hypothetical protein [Trifolium medium]